MKGNGKDDYIIVLTLRSGGLPSVGGECDLCLRSRDSERSSRELLFVFPGAPLLSFKHLRLADPRIFPQKAALSAPYTHPGRGGEGLPTPTPPRSSHYTYLSDAQRKKGWSGKYSELKIEIV